MFPLSGPFQVYGAHYGLIALIWILLVKTKPVVVLFRPSPHFKEKNIYPSQPPYLLLWLGEQEEVLPFRPISTDVGTRLQLFMMDGSEKPFLLPKTRFASILLLCLSCK